jgi:hypothetical protein
MKPITMEQINQMASRLGLASPEKFRSQTLADKERLREFQNRFGPKEGALIHDTRQLGHTTQLILLALCEIDRGRTVFLRGHNREDSLRLVSLAREQGEKLHFPIKLLHPYVQSSQFQARKFSIPVIVLSDIDARSNLKP